MTNEELLHEARHLLGEVDYGARIQMSAEWCERVDLFLDLSFARDCKPAEPGADERAASEAYDKVDRFLRNNLDDADYAEYSEALECVRVAQSGQRASASIADVQARYDKTMSAYGFTEYSRGYGDCLSRFKEQLNQSGQRAGVAEGWRFYSADFSITAHQPSQPGYVMLIRDETGYKKWHRMDEAAKEEIPLFVTGRGVTFEKALLHANENAMLAAAPTQQQEGGS